MTTVCAKDHGQSWTDPMGFWTKQRSRITRLSVGASTNHPRPTNGMLLAITVMFSTFADNGRLAI
jgi:hypothetical protein